jgi:AcrR family transcriptional regulator
MSEATHTAEPVDGRREAGERTRQRLIDATRELIAQHGEAGVSLRAITDAADANVASVSYHFGSKDALVTAAIEQSLEQLVQDQIDRICELDDPTLDEIAAAWSGPVVCSIAASPCREQAFMRVVGRTLSSCSGQRRLQMTAQSARAEEELIDRLARLMPDVGADELRFRSASVGAILNFVTSGQAGLDGKPAAEIERLLVPVVAGALAGGPRA